MSKMVTHHYTACGLPNIWIRCRRVTDDAGKKTFIIPNVKELHKTIAHAVVLKEGALTGAELRFLRSEMGLTADEFDGMICRSAATISRWENGKGVSDAVTEGFIRILAADKLKLDGIDPATISKNHKPEKSTPPVRIEAVSRGHYRLAA